MVRKIYKNLPLCVQMGLKNFIGRYRMALYYLYRINILAKYTPITGHHSKTSRTANIVGTYHVIEKGLTMPDRRLGFGQKRLIELIEASYKYVELYGYDNFCIKEALGVINEYNRIHLSLNYPLSTPLQKRINTLLDMAHKNGCEIYDGGQCHFSQEDYFKHKNSSFPDFSSSRHSVRNFIDKEVDLQELSLAIQLALNAPSACNRQGNRVYVINKKDRVANFLEIQGGSRGFSHKVNCLLIVTNDSRVWTDPKSIQGSYIDGGIFSMNLLYSLHFHKIGACPLNCYFSPKKANKIHKDFSIPEYENIILAIAVGYVPDNFDVVNSHRDFSLNQILKII